MKKDIRSGMDWDWDHRIALRLRLLDWAPGVYLSSWSLTAQKVFTNEAELISLSSTYFTFVRNNSHLHHLLWPISLFWYLTQVPLEFPFLTGRILPTFLVHILDYAQTKTSRNSRRFTTSPTIVVFLQECKLKFWSRERTGLQLDQSCGKSTGAITIDQLMSTR